MIKLLIKTRGSCWSQSTQCYCHRLKTEESPASQRRWISPAEWHRNTHKGVWDFSVNWFLLHWSERYYKQWHSHSVSSQLFVFCITSMSWHFSKSITKNILDPNYQESRNINWREMCPQITQTYDSIRKEVQRYKQLNVYKIIDNTKITLKYSR